MKKNLILSAVLTSAICLLSKPLFAQTSEIESTSNVDWIKREFNSTIVLDLRKADIKMPSGKNAALLKINTKIPNLIKDPLLTLYVDSDSQLGDKILTDDITLENVVNVISNSKQTLGYLKDESSSLKTNHSIKINDLSSLLISHNAGYKVQLPIEHVASRPFTGIIIDARGSFPVHGEYVKSEISPCFFPCVWDEEMSKVYESNMMKGSDVKQLGACVYDYSDDIERYKDRIGNDPLRITAKKAFGRNRTDIIISKTDALKITSVAENRELLKQGKVVILLDKDQLIYKAKAPIKDELYYTALKKIELYPSKGLADIENVEAGPTGLRFTFDLKFIADSEELLPSELPRIRDLATMLKDVNRDDAFTILVEGHTADIGQPENQMQLSIDRTQTIIRELVKEGMNEKSFSYRGYGATQPLGDNKATPEGMARNRRVVITLRPKTTYIQREW